MSLHDHHTHSHVFHVAARVDPTRTIMVRRRFEQDLVRRFKTLRKAIKTAIVDHNALKLDLRINDAFGFPTSTEKIASFMSWLRKQVRSGILEIEPGVPVEKAAQRAWSNVYVRAAYQKGMSRAYGIIRSAGVEVSDQWISTAFYRPMHADRMGLIYTRTYSDLNGITNDMDAKISRELAQGIADGIGVEELANRLVNIVDGIGVSRARLLARTEVIRAHAEASLNSYEEAGAEGVIIETEFATAGDSSVCPKCDDLGNQVYKLEDARGLIPVHPNCRCAWLPVLSDPSGIRLI